MVSGFSNSDSTHTTRQVAFGARALPDLTLEIR